MNIEQLIKLHKCGIYNREKVENTDLCGCFYCKKTFQPNEINNGQMRVKLPSVLNVVLIL